MTDFHGTSITDAPDNPGQALELRPLAQRGSTATARPTPILSATSPTHEPALSAPPHSPAQPPVLPLPASEGPPHGTRPGPEADAAENCSNTASVPTGHDPDGPGLMTSKPPFLRSSPSFASPSYGAIPSSTQSTAAAAAAAASASAYHDHALSSSSSSFVSTSADERHPPNMRRRASRDVLADSRTLRSMPSVRFSEDLGASTTLGGLEGRFGMTETAVPTDVLDSPKQDGDGASDVGLLGRDDGDDDGDDVDSVDFDEDPPDNSPYPQVRASVPPTDNVSLSINTPRMWAMSVLFSVLGSATNLFFSLRYPSVAITPVIALLLVHPLGRLWDLLLKRADDPPEEYVDGFLAADQSAPGPGGLGHLRSAPSPPRSRLGRLRLWLGQGRWNEKEHTCVYVSSNVSFGFAFATDVIVEQTRFYKQDVGVTYQLLLTLSTQILGYTFAGLARRFLVRPSSMIWPGTLMSAAMFSTLHKDENRAANGWTMSRWNFFYAVWTAAFLFYFLPGLLMPALSYFSVITWFAPDNVVVANLFGVTSGLGLFPLTFDWAQIAYIGSPLLTPFWAAMNVVGGLVIVMWLIAPIAYYSNWLYSSYMPMLSAAVFDNTGHVYDVSRILTEDFVFDREAYRDYSRVFLPITYVLSYGVQFAGLASLLTHTVCWHGRDIWTQWKRSIHDPLDAKDTPTPMYRPVSRSNGEASTSRERGTHRFASMPPDGENLMSREDVHNRLMRRYKDAPMWWYLATFVSMTAIGIFVVEYYPIHLPWYGLLLALGICSILFIPIGIIMAVTNQHSSIYLICQLICGATFPGRPVANMLFVTYGYISSAQGIKFAADLKLGHYMKIPPRILFSVQMVATVVSSLTQITVLNWMFLNVPGLCTTEAINGFTCPIARVHFNGSILWGVVGPGEFFGPNATYRGLVWAFLIGAVLPVPLWLYGRNRKDSIVRKINLPVLFGSLGWIPPATGLNFSVWALVCYLFNYLIKNRATAWWAKYTMTLSAALDSGLAFGIVVVFFGFIYPGWMKGFSWWGTEVYKAGCDWQACSYKSVPEGTHFGPDTW